MTGVLSPFLRKAVDNLAENVKMYKGFCVNWGFVSIGGCTGRETEPPGGSRTEKKAERMAAACLKNSTEKTK